MANEDKRKISLGFIRPEELEQNKIYIDIGNGQDGLCATAYSNKKFTYHCHSIGGNLLTRSERYHTTYDGCVTSSWEINYKFFINDIVESNNAELEGNERLIEDGSKLVQMIKESIPNLEKGMRLLNFKKPHKPKINSEQLP